MFDFNAGNSSRTLDNSWSHRLSTDNPHPVNVFHINADQMPLAYDLLGRDFFRGHYNVGFWHWELPELPNEYLPGFAALQEVWVPSAFVLDAVSAKSPVPVVKMPHAVEFAVDNKVTRARMGLPEGKFLFLTMYDLHSYHERKNPEAVIAAFRKAFRDRSDVMLVVKVQNTNSCPEEFARLQEVAAESGNMLLIGNTMRREEVYNLEWLCDCFVSLHRSEGFGLGLAESMYLGKPVVGTNWSGNTEFMRPSNSFTVDYRLVQIDRDVGVYRRGQWWAEPDIEHAAWSMAKLVADDELRREIALQGQQTLRTNFSPAAIGARIQRRLKFIRQMLEA
jgi:glycosyltransferase involved in cell wall biosynthesis